MSDYNGYQIEEYKEQTGNEKDPDSIHTIQQFRVLLGDRVLAVGLHSEQVAKDTIDRRIKIRTRGGLEAVG